MKIGIIGTGSVGATIAYSIAVKGLASNLVLVDKFAEKAVGEAMDLKHCASFIPPVEISAGDCAVCANMDVIIITAGTKRKPEEQRTDLIKRNLEVFKEITLPLAQSNPNAIFIVVSNPVDLLTLYLLKHTDLAPRQVIGSGTLLDTSRFRYLISERFRVDPRNVHAYIIGEHGAGSVPVWSHTQVGVLPADVYAKQTKIQFGDQEKQEIFEKVLNAGKEIINRKGATFYGIAQTVVRILTAIIRNEQSILTISTNVAGFEEVEDSALSLPVIVGRQGATRILSPQLSPDESQAFRQAAEAQYTLAKEVGIL
jgi:L-lactate dehydrogenase